MSLFSRAALLASVLATPVLASESVYSDLLQTEHRLTSPAASRGVSSQEQLEHLQALAASSAGEPVLQAKVDAVLRLARFLSNAPQGLVIEESRSEPVRLVLQQNSRASECGFALPLKANSSLQMHLHPDQSVWFRVDAQPGEDLRVSTRGSTIDARLSAFLDCRVATDPALVEADDSFGLQADLGLSQERSGQSFWLVRLDNVGPVAGRAEVTAGSAIVVSGTVVRDQGSLPLANHGVAAHLSQGSFLSFYTSTQTNASGAFSIALTQAGTYGFRTGTYYSSSANVVDEAWENASCRSSDPYYFNNCGSESSPPTLIDLQPGDSRSLDFRLDGAPILGGTITSEVNLAPVRFANVSVVDQTGSTRWTGQTDAAGRFSTVGLAPDRFYLQVSATSHQTQVFDGVSCSPQTFCDPRSGTPIDLTANEFRQVNMRLRRSPSVRVQLNVGGQPALNTSNTIDLLNSNGAVVRSATSYSTAIIEISDVAPGSYRVRARSGFGFTGLYPGIECSSDCASELGQATPVVVVANTAGPELQMDLRPFPAVSGQVTNAITGTPLGATSLYLLPTSSGGSLYAVSDSEGEYSFRAVPPGTYLMLSRRAGFQTEAHRDIPCNSGNPLLDCQGASLIQITNSSADQDVDVDLTPSASVAGRALRANGTPVSDFSWLSLVDASGTVVMQTNLYPDSNGNYRMDDLPIGNFRVAMSTWGSVPQIYPGIDCPSASSGNFSGCNFSGASFVSFESGMTASDIDFNLMPLGARTVRVLSASTGLPLAGIAIDLWTTTGTRVDTLLTDGSGYAYPSHSSGSGTVQSLLSTFNTQGLLEQVYQDRPCPNGSAFFGLCSLQGATQVAFPGPAGAQPLIFRMGSADEVFGNGFEAQP